MNGLLFHHQEFSNVLLWFQNCFHREVCQHWAEVASTDGVSPTDSRGRFVSVIAQVCGKLATVLCGNCTCGKSTLWQGCSVARVRSSDGALWRGYSVARVPLSRVLFLVGALWQRYLWQDYSVASLFVTRVLWARVLCGKDACDKRTPWQEYIVEEYTLTKVLCGKRTMWQRYTVARVLCNKGTLGKGTLWKSTL